MSRSARPRASGIGARAAHPERSDRRSCPGAHRRAPSAPYRAGSRSLRRQPMADALASAIRAGDSHKKSAETFFCVETCLWSRRLELGRGAMLPATVDSPTRRIVSIARQIESLAAAGSGVLRPAWPVGRFVRQGRDEGHPMIDRERGRSQLAPRSVCWKARFVRRPEGPPVGPPEIGRSRPAAHPEHLLASHSTRFGSARGRQSR